MASEQPRRRKPVSEEKRERDVFLLYGAAFRDLPHLDSLGPNSETCSLPGEHVPRVSTDSTLTALAQLATFKLGAGRAMISLIDGERQYILAEATPNTSLRPGAPDAPSTLWLGSISIPRTWGMCEKVLNIDLQAFQAQEYPALVVKDLKESVEHANRSYIKESSVRFYASAPLRSPTGSIVGSVCVLDDVPRPDGLSQLHRESLRDIAESTMDYLHAYTVKDQYQRGEQFTRGLISFSEGASSLLPFENVTQHDPEASVSINPGLTSRGSISQHAKPSDPVNPEEEMTPRKKSATVRIKGRRQRSTQSLQESILPVDSRTMFARAANVMMASSNLDGVVILDASVAANRHEQHKNSDRRSGTETGTGTEDAGSSYQSRTSSSDEGAAQRGERVSGRSKACQVLGSAITKGIPFGDPSTEATFGPLLETDLARMLHDFPHGKILTFGINGLPVSSSDEGSSSAASDGNNSAPPRRRTTETQKYRISKAIIDMIPGVRSVAFIPFWDYERSRWFAGCVCWSLSPVRLLSASVDLAYFKVFSHSIMRELSRLDALALNQAKTTFVASISHELRSPLHGILGTLEFIKDTPLDAFQISMLNSLNACGQTLLDTINHVMDYAKISEGMRSVSSRRLKSTHTVRLSSRPHKSRRPKAGGFDLGIATEEVIEAVFSGSSYVPVSGAVMDAGSTASGSEAEPTITAKRKSCFIVLDIAQQDNWVYSFPIGSWRRIVMNIFGNAIKYTETGHIHVSLRVHDGSRVTGAPTAVVLTVTDSGLGMSPQYLANKAFQPFSQENSFAVGTGLGLSIVRQIIETNGGKIEVNSEPSVGTKFTVKLALTKPTSTQIVPPQRAQLLSFLPRLEGVRICILRRLMAPSSGSTTTSRCDEGFVRFTNALADTLHKNLKMHVIQTDRWQGHECDVVIVPELSFDYLAAIRRSRLQGRKAPITIFCAMDALEAATLRSDARVQRKESVVEIMTQPCGPYKLAYILHQCLDRFELPEENLSHDGSSSVGYESPRLPYPNSERLLTQSPPIEQPQKDTQIFLDRPSVSELTSVTPPPEDTIELAIRPAQIASQILIVDDNAINRSLLIAFMKRHKYRYQEAANGLEALETYQRQPYTFKTVLMDLSMPIMDGMSSTRAIRQFEDLHNIPQCLIVALTGLASASARLEALSSGVDKFITKPLNFRVLASLLEDTDETRRQRDEMREFRRMSKNDDVERTSNGTHKTQEARFQQGNCKVELDMSVKQPESHQDVPNTTANGTYETHEAEVDLSVKQLQSTELEQKPGPTQEERDPAYIRDHKHSEEVEPPVQDMTSESRRVDVAGEKEAHHEINEIEPLGEVKEEHAQQDVEHRVEGQDPREGNAQPKVEKKESPSEAGDDERLHEMEPRTRTEPEEVEARPGLPDEH